ncbi:c-type cytochrome [Rubrimonas cliftonensis]|uniref:Cytochrome c553 n=1 Tax=Rubrimonas cliftonensis TaxID=89524 RepID=A0A1H3WZ50_9RHOB|nr:c-type cytochrome [Rubrimonas cliftonensis]SDZ92031.1 Cytochrome c553 [Rubrimonas cliftonensis]
MRADPRRTAGQRGLVALAFSLLGAAAAGAADIDALAEQCAGCHGEGGVSQMAEVPSLAGQPEFFLFDQLFYMREGVRQVEAMEGIADGLSDAEIDALAKRYAAADPALAGPEPDPARVADGAALAEARRCASCHGAGLTGREAIPRLARQRVDYLRHALIAYRDETRRGADTTMTAAVHGLSDGDLDALAHYAAAQ